MPQITTHLFRQESQKIQLKFSTAHFHLLVHAVHPVVRAITCDKTNSHSIPDRTAFPREHEYLNPPSNLASRPSTELRLPTSEDVASASEDNPSCGWGVIGRIAQTMTYPVQFCEELREHPEADLASTGPVCALASHQQSVDFVEEDNGGSKGTCHRKEGLHVSLRVPDPLREDAGRADVQEDTLRFVSHCLGLH